MTPTPMTRTPMTPTPPAMSRTTEPLPGPFRDHLHAGDVALADSVADRLEAVFAQERVKPATTEIVHVLDLAPVRVSSFRGEGLEEEGVEVGHREEEGAAARQQRLRALQRGSRKRHVLEDVGHRDDVEGSVAREPRDVDAVRFEASGAHPR